jgi:glycine/sarcosine N-methyltransferase
VTTSDKSDSREPTDAAAFYDALAPDYDEMTGFAARFAREMPAYRTIVERFHISSAIDAGTGTGFHAILLAKLGVQTVAADISETMLERAKRNVLQEKVQIRTVRSDFIALPENVPHDNDALFCLGNALAHVRSEPELKETIRSFRRVLKPGSILMLQVLNFERMLTLNARIHSVKEIGEKTFVRFYDFLGDRIQFNLLTIRRTDGGIRHSLASVDLRAWRAEELQILLEELRFGKVECYGNIALDPFDRTNSHDLVILATAQ